MASLYNVVCMCLQTELRWIMYSSWVYYASNSSAYTSSLLLLLFLSICITLAAAAIFASPSPQEYLHHPRHRKCLPALRNWGSQACFTVRARGGKVANIFTLLENFYLVFIKLVVKESDRRVTKSFLEFSVKKTSNIVSKCKYKSELTFEAREYSSMIHSRNVQSTPIISTHPWCIKSMLIKLRLMIMIIIL